ncbi:unnamed protein product [Prorocentrum cordatum]|uniref:Uncharacterized protein n=1 Tax=Prorocentrum cordatum TaxID=2364126 RepID=A0ABN9RYV0_9DINO|nr:unnamed protein product [Polarella glacialis]
MPSGHGHDGPWRRAQASRAGARPDAISYDVGRPSVSRFELDADVLQWAVVNNDASGVAYWRRHPLVWRDPLAPEILHQFLANVCRFAAEYGHWDIAHLIISEIKKAPPMTVEDLISYKRRPARARRTRSGSGQWGDQWCNNVIRYYSKGGDGKGSGRDNRACGERLVNVGNLSYDVDWCILQDHLKQAGTVEYCRVTTEDGTVDGRSMGLLWTLVFSFLEPLRPQLSSAQVSKLLFVVLALSARPEPDVAAELAGSALPDAPQPEDEEIEDSEQLQRALACLSSGIGDGPAAAASAAFALDDLDDVPGPLADVTVDPRVAHLPLFEHAFSEVLEHLEDSGCLAGEDEEKKENTSDQEDFFLGGLGEASGV